MMKLPIVLCGVLFIASAHAVALSANVTEAKNEALRHNKNFFYEMSATLPLRVKKEEKFYSVFPDRAERLGKQFRDTAATNLTALQSAVDNIKNITKQFGTFKCSRFLDHLKNSTEAFNGLLTRCSANSLQIHEDYKANVTEQLSKELSRVKKIREHLRKCTGMPCIKGAHKRGENAVLKFYQINVAADLAHGSFDARFDSSLINCFKSTWDDLVAEASTVEKKTNKCARQSKKQSRSIR